MQNRQAFEVPNSNPCLPKLPMTGRRLGPSKTVALISMILEQHRGCFYIFSINMDNGWRPVKIRGTSRRS